MITHGMRQEPQALAFQPPIRRKVRTAVDRRNPPAVKRLASSFSPFLTINEVFVANVCYQIACIAYQSKEAS